MKPKSLSLVIGIAVLAAPFAARAAEYYVAPTGSDSAAGTEAAPFATVGGRRRPRRRATRSSSAVASSCSPASGTVGVAFSKSGTHDRPHQLLRLPGRDPHLRSLQPDAAEPRHRPRRALQLHPPPRPRGAGRAAGHPVDSWGVRIQGSNNVIENLNVHNNDAPGIFITSGGNNLILNCDSHHNYDSLEGGGSGDGFGCHSSGGGNILRGCRACRQQRRRLRLHQRRRARAPSSSRSRSATATSARHDDRGGQRRRLQGRRLRLAAQRALDRRRDAHGPPVRGLRQPVARVLRQPPPGADQLLQQHGLQQRGQLQHAGGLGLSVSHTDSQQRRVRHRAGRSPT